MDKFKSEALSLKFEEIHENLKNQKSTNQKSEILNSLIAKHQENQKQEPKTEKFKSEALSLKFEEIHDNYKSEINKSEIRNPQLTEARSSK